MLDHKKIDKAILPDPFFAKIASRRAPTALRCAGAFFKRCWKV